MNKVQVKVKSRHEIIINKLKSYDIKIYDAKQENDFFLFKTTYDDYKIIKKYLPYLKIEIVKYYGKNKIIQYLKEYQYYIIAFVISLAFLFLISNIMIEVNVIHSSKKIRQLVSDALEDYGIKKYSFKKNYDELNKIKTDILEKYKGDLEWLEIEIHGMKYVIRVEQRIINKPIKNPSYCHIIAKKSGVITDVLTKKGESLITRNTYVNKGDILISGDIKFNDEVKERVCAKGTIKAEVWYQVNVVMPLYYTTKVKTGKMKTNFAYDKGLGKKALFKNKYKKSIFKYHKLFGLFGVKFYKIKELEITEVKHKYNEEEAIKKAILLAMEKINIKKQDKDKIITQKVLKKSLNDSTISLEVFFAIEEEIGYQETLDRDGEVS